MEATSSPNAANVLAPYTVIQAQTVEPPTVPGWTKQTGETHLASPKLADLDGDGVEEIVLATSGAGAGTGSLHAWRGDGSALSGFPVTLSQPSLTTPAIGDLDGDGDREVVTASTSYVDVWEHDGAPVPGWNKWISPRGLLLADVDGDGQLELFVNRSLSVSIGYEHDGTQKAIYSIPGSTSSSPGAAGDLDLDGDLEIVAKGAGQLAAWHGDGTPVAGFPVAACGSSSQAPVLGDLDDDGTLEIVVPSSCVNLVVLDHLGGFEPGWPQAAPRSASTSSRRSPTSTSTATSRSCSSATRARAARRSRPSTTTGARWRASRSCSRTRIPRGRSRRAWSGTPTATSSRSSCCTRATRSSCSSTRARWRRATRCSSRRRS